MSNMEDMNTFYDKVTLPFDFNKILHNQPSPSKNDSFSSLEFNY